jgi:O-antigen/teichoic acid export membrane protein
VSGSHRATLTVLDQGFSSVSNFAVGVAVARIAGASGLGGFSFAYAGWLMLAAMHRSLVTDPMAIEGDARDPTVTRGIARGFAAEVLLGATGTVIFAVLGATLMLAGQRTFGTGLLAISPFLPALVVQDYWRWVGFMSLRPGRSLANDTVFNCAQGIAFAAVIATHTHSVSLVIGAWGFGGLAGAVYGLRQYRVRPSLSGGSSTLRSRWLLSKWLAGQTLMTTSVYQVNLFIVGVVLGPVGLGGLRAAQTLVMGPAGVLIQAGGSIGLPEATKAYAEKGWSGLTRVCRIVMVAGFVSSSACLAAVAIWGRWLLSEIYGPQFARFNVAAILIGLSMVSVAFSLGPILVLKATRNTRHLFHVTLISFAISIGGAAALSAVAGVNGAATALLASVLVEAVAFRWFQHKVKVSFQAEGALASGLLEGEVAVAADAL